MTSTTSSWRALVTIYTDSDKPQVVNMTSMTWIDKKNITHSMDFPGGTGKLGSGKAREYWDHLENQGTALTFLILLGIGALILFMASCGQRWDRNRRRRHMAKQKRQEEIERREKLGGNSHEMNRFSSMNRFLNTPQAAREDFRAI
ncbi:uncharacterized protein KY384_000201 [Bacidia gigantensis]|uniref:uncharacterized protein n=1 Tax=Bacidia gigantensis TaxID=2732470 RepID=UPI001D058AFD|nr:uncharacterized protein KY384_000201 [Bacidia gigantensis]KAG8526208.1 hypothetical protein KY384_000201 [Bacidia gigantensis]